MKKNKMLFAAIAMVISAGVMASPQSNKDELAQFEKTNQCPGCDLSGANISANHSGAAISGANLSNIRTSHKNGVNFSQADATNANFSGALLWSANFSQANLSGAHFDGANLTQANFYGATNANLSNGIFCLTTMPDGKVTGC